MYFGDTGFDEQAARSVSAVFYPYPFKLLNSKWFFSIVFPWHDI
jgi:hypothetical protein